MADDHILESIEHVVGSDYAGSHWLATFLTYAIQKREEALLNLQEKISKTRMPFSIFLVREMDL